MTDQPTRKEFLQSMTGLALTPAISQPAANPGIGKPKALIVVAHPDDEYACAATVYRITRELGGIADQVIITNGEGGFRYSELAEAIYRVPLTRETDGRAHLPSIRKAETRRAGEILGVRQHHFLNQRDSGFSGDAARAGTTNWDRPRVLSTLSLLLTRERYNFVFVLLPTAETHGHHREAALLALEAVSRLPIEERPAVLGADPARKPNGAGEPSNSFSGLPGFPLTQTQQISPALVVDRTASFGYRRALNYQIVVNWVIAEHKSQGLFQTDYGRHEIEQFWLFQISGTEGDLQTKQLAEVLDSFAAKDMRQAAIFQ